MATTIKDVAKHAGVGVGTVSRVLNNSRLVSDVTRDKVLSTIKALNYVPNSSARRLSLGKTMTIGVTGPFFTRPHFVERLKGVERIVSDTLYDLNIFNIESIQRQSICIQDIARHHKVDGLLLISFNPSSNEIEVLKEAGIKFVLIDGDAKDEYSVVINDIEGGRIATHHLVEHGHRRIGFISDFLNTPLGNNSMHLRFMGYQEALLSAGIDFNEDYIRHGFHGDEEAKELALQVLSLPDRPTAIFAASDTQAIGVLEAAKMLKIGVPDQLSIIGFDDLEVAKYLNLTTVNQQLQNSGVKGAEILLNLLSDTDDAAELPLQVELPLQIVERGTVQQIDPS